MAQIAIRQGQLFHTDNHTLYTIANGSVTASYPGGTALLSEGDTAGIFELFGGNYFFTYQANEDIVLNTRTFSSPEVLQDFLAQNNQSRQQLFSSALSQMQSLFRQYEMTVYECQSSYESLLNDYKYYVFLCQKYQYPAQSLTGFDKIKAPVMTSSGFLSSYYERLGLSDAAVPLYSDAWLTVGSLFHFGRDCEQLLQNSRELSAYRNQITSLYLNSEGTDLITLNLSLLSRFRPGQEDAPALLAKVLLMLTNPAISAHPDTALLQERKTRFQQQKTRLTESTGKTEAPEETDASALLEASLEQILGYSGLTIEEKETLRQLVSQYKALPDRTSTEENARLLYRKLTDSFLLLYRNISMKALQDTNIPIVVQMFLYFGYLDETLAGTEHALELYKMAAAIKPPAAGSHIYPLFFWLKEIYEGRKEPSRNEFDEEYSDALHHLKLKGSITAAQEKELLGNTLRKVEYELNCMFPQVNKMTYGRISTYCPVFSEHNVLRSLSTSLITAGKLEDAVQKIRAIDYSAFYRETIYSNPDIGINKEYIHLEVLPDFILMPNVGTRGVMWQEIENRRRTTSCRMMLSIFHLEELYPAIIHLTGEYRWEMCRRVQGARWNDLTELSLTSEYFDYIQFYRKNNDLSPDAREKIKSSLVKTKNNYKEMFVLDYMAWILYESASSPRLNKVARNILFNYCPFPKEIRGTLDNNPIYREILDRYNVRNAQKIHHMELVRQKLGNLRSGVPDEIEREYQYLNS